MLSWKITYLITIHASISIKCVQQNKAKDDWTTKFAFGGCLQERVHNVNGTELDRAAMIAIEYASKRTATKFPKDELGNILPFHIVSSTVAKLMYTHNGKTPFMLQVLNERTGQPINTPIVWGLIYTFKTQWDQPEDESKLLHSFVLFQYWDYQFYTYQYTLHTSEYPGNKDSIHNSIAKLSIQDDSFYVRTDEYAKEIMIDQSYTSKTQGKNRIESANRDSEYRTIDIFDKSTTCGDKMIKQISSSVANSRDVFLNLIYQMCTINDGNFNSQNTLEASAKKHIINKDDTITSTHTQYQTYHNRANNSHTMKLLSFNIWNVNVVKGGDPQYVKRIKKLAKLCLETKADVIGFQEVRFQDGKGGTLGANQVGHLAQFLPEYQYIYQPAQIQLDDLPKFVTEGLAFFSKYPIVNHDSLFLERNPKDPADGHQRILLHIEVDLPGFGKSHFFNTHLSLSHKARATSVVEIWKYMQKFEGPSFLVGDFNSEAHNDEIRFLAGDKEMKKSITEGLLDLWTVKHGHDSKGYTFNTLDAELSKRIDLIFMKKHENVKFEDISLVDDGKRGEYAVSDHLGITAVFTSAKQ